VDGLQAFQRNWIGFFDAATRYSQAARSWREDGLVIGITGLPISAFNAAIVLDEASLTPERIPKLAEPFEEAGLPFSIQVCSRAPVPACAEAVKSLGYVELFADPVMICEGSLQPVAANPAVDIQPAVASEDRACYREILVQGFSLPPDVSPEFFDLLLSLREGYHLLARLDGEPVGSGMLLYAGGVAAIYNVATLPSVRRQGIAAAMMLRLHSQALADGYPATVLASSPMGLPLYHRLGYRHTGYQIGYAFPGPW
jgi:GNAT superfamily N-acetyltransferase